MTVAHFVWPSTFRSHLAQVIVPVIVVSFAFSSAVAVRAKAQTSARPTSIDRAVLIVQPPLCVSPPPGLRTGSRVRGEYIPAPEGKQQVNSPRPLHCAAAAHSPLTAGGPRLQSSFRHSTPT